MCGKLVNVATVYTTSSTLNIKNHRSDQVTYLQSTYCGLVFLKVF